MDAVNHLEFNVVPYSPELDLTEFYQNAQAQGYVKHTTPEVFNYDRELRAQAWVVYQDGHPIASFAAHTMFPRPEFKGTIAYMVWNSMCVLRYTPIGTFGPRAFWDGYQNFNAQVVAPTCINWVYEQEGTTDVDMFTSHSHKRKPPYDKTINIMSRHWGRMGIVSHWKDSEINGETVEWWRVDHKLFMEGFNNNPKWPVTYRRSL